VDQDATEDTHLLLGHIGKILVLLLDGYTTPPNGAYPIVLQNVIITFLENTLTALVNSPLPNAQRPVTPNILRPILMIRLRVLLLMVLLTMLPRFKLKL